MGATRQVAGPGDAVDQAAIPSARKGEPDRRRTRKDRYMTPRIVFTASEKKAQQLAGRKFQCHVDCDETDEMPIDDCVLDYDKPAECRHALRRRVRETCRYWQPARQGDPHLAEDDQSTISKPKDVSNGAI